MNYKESKEILDEIKKANKILLNCHRGPDPDSVGSALALSYVLKQMGKSVKIICPSEKLYDRLIFLPGYLAIESKVDFASFNFSDYDLFLSLDSSSWDMVSGLKNSRQPEIPLMVIDHHATNLKFGNVNLVDMKATSVGEVIYGVFEDWKVKIDKEIANCIMAAIIGDTGSFRYPGQTFRTFEVASKLMKLGADKDKIVFAIYQSDPYELIRFYGEGLSRVEIDRDNKFVWASIPFMTYKQLDQNSSARESIAALFAQSVDGTNFGMVLSEEEPNVLKISLRGRTNFDTTLIALELGGGGHKKASGATVRGLPFDEAVRKVLEVARKYAKEYLKSST